MAIQSLHPNQVRILDALKSAIGTLKMTEQLAIVGGLARHLGGDAKPPGDIDVLIERPLCERYWEFLEILVKHGIMSVRDVLDRPAFHWRPCIPAIAHARALTIDSGATLRDEKHGALDICFKVTDLDHIPRSDQWVDILDINLSGAARAKAIHDGRERLKDELRKRECELSAPIMSGELGLYYRFKKPAF